jgi:hypothetical protein
MAAALPNEVFLSHSNQNRQFADKLAEVLRFHNVPVWYSQINIIGAQQWHDEIGEALRRCDWFAIVLSQDSVESEWVKHELMYALRDNRFKNKIIPIVYEHCDPERLSWILPEFQFINFVENFDDGCRDLLRMWGLGYKIRNVEP